jgi:hypothetical protein
MENPDLNIKFILESMPGIFIFGINLIFLFMKEIFLTIHFARM